MLFEVNALHYEVVISVSYLWFQAEVLVTLPAKPLCLDE